VNADAFRHFYACHFSENRNIWDTYITQLSDGQFTQETSYSRGSVRNQVVHLMSVDDTWFSALRGVEIPDSLDPAAFVDRRVLLHVGNHGTDHRAQTLRLLNDLGVKTVSQDYIFYVYDHPQG
jgi:uncharacterized damage-inducible protein DinB